MGVRRTVEIELVDDSDLASITVEPRSLPDTPDRFGPRPWAVSSSAGGTTVYVSSADLLEFASALRELVETDPFRSEPEA